MKHLLIIILCLPVLSYSQTIRSWGIDTVGWENNVFVDSLAGKPIEFYLNHPDIDTYQKKFYKGKFAINNDPHTYSIVREIPENKETLPFTFFNLCRILEKTDTFQEEILEAFMVYVIATPCLFLDMWKDNGYKIDRNALSKQISVRYFPDPEIITELEKLWVEKYIPYALENLKKECPNRETELNKFIAQYILNNVPKSK